MSGNREVIGGCAGLLACLVFSYNGVAEAIRYDIAAPSASESGKVPVANVKRFS